MVNKMKLKFFFCGLFSCCYIWSAQAADLGLSLIKQRQYVACGINSEYTPLAHKEDGIYRGFDADLCRAFAAAVLGNAEAFRLIPVQQNEIRSAFDNGKIDVLLGHANLLPADEASAYVLPIDTLYIDRIVFVSRVPTTAQSMKDFGEGRVCTQAKSADNIILKDYIQKYALPLKVFESPTVQALKESFYLKRCDLLFSNEILAKTLIQNLHSSEKPEILPEHVTQLPVKAYTDARNATLNIAFRSIVNALKQATVAQIQMNNLDAFSSSKSESIQKLLGINPSAWKKLGLEPTWFKDYVATYGNYAQILERNFGEESPLKIDLEYNRLFDDGGLLPYQLFF
jgi:general L-amino acid transport system substrate-binding protein